MEGVIYEDAKRELLEFLSGINEQIKKARIYHFIDEIRRQKELDLGLERLLPAEGSDAVH